MDCYGFGCPLLRSIYGTLIIADNDSLVPGRKHICSKRGSDKKDFDAIIVPGVEKAPFPINLLGMLKSTQIGKTRFTIGPAAWKL